MDITTRENFFLIKNNYHSSSQLEQSVTRSVFALYSEPPNSTQLLSSLVSKTKLSPRNKRMTLQHLLTVEKCILVKLGPYKNILYTIVSGIRRLY